LSEQRRTILVCPLSKVVEMIAVHKPSCVISLLDPGYAFPELGPTYDGKHLQLSFHDVHNHAEDQVLPSVEHINQLLSFLGAWTSGENLLIHCRAGMGRSPAAAFITACYLNPNVPEREIAVALRLALCKTQ